MHQRCGKFKVNPPFVSVQALSKLHRMQYREQNKEVEKNKILMEQSNYRSIAEQTD